MSLLAWSEEFLILATSLDRLSQNVSHELLKSQMKGISGNLRSASNAFLQNGDPQLIASQLLKMFEIVNGGGVAGMARSVLDPDAFEEFQDIMQAVNANASYVKGGFYPEDRVGLLASENDESRKWAALTLGFSSQRTRAVEFLLKSLRDLNSSVRIYSALALGRLEDTAAVESLGSALVHDDHGGVRSAAAWALGEFNDVAAIRFLEQGINDQDADVREAAKKALSKHAKLAH